MLKKALSKFLKNPSDINPISAFEELDIVSRLIHTSLNLSLKKIAITPSSFLILKHLYSMEKELSPLQISKNLTLKPSFITSVLKNFESKKLISFNVDKEDKRYKTVEITQKGGEVFKQASKVVNDHLSSVLNEINQEDLDLFFKILKKISSKKLL